MPWKVRLGPDVLFFDSRKLENLSRSTARLENGHNAGVQTMSSQLSQSTSQLGDQIKAGFSVISSRITGAESASDARHHTVLDRLINHEMTDNHTAQKLNEVHQRQLGAIDISEVGFQAIRSDITNAALLNYEWHDTTNALLVQNKVQLQQILSNQIASGTVEHS
ncbi:MAG: hypothetical protein Q9164_002599, partial [Protoblastenia rupestris]